MKGPLRLPVRPRSLRRQVRHHRPARQGHRSHPNHSQQIRYRSPVPLGRGRTLLPPRQCAETRSLGETDVIVIVEALKRSITLKKIQSPIVYDYRCASITLTSLRLALCASERLGAIPCASVKLLGLWKCVDMPLQIFVRGTIISIPAHSKHERRPPHLNPARGASW